jgi:hypothetical protein
VAPHTTPSTEKEGQADDQGPGTGLSASAIESGCAAPGTLLLYSLANPQ